MNEQYIETYNNNPDVKEYVDKYSTKHRVSVNEALTHVIVQNTIQFKLKEVKHDTDVKTDNSSAVNDKHTSKN